MADGRRPFPDAGRDDSWNARKTQRDEKHRRRNSRGRQKRSQRQDDDPGRQRRARKEHRHEGSVPRLSARMLDILMRGVSSRQYKRVIPQMADTVGVSKSSVSRQMIEASEAEVEALLSRRFDEVKLVILYIDGMVFGDHIIIGAVGVDIDGNKHLLAIREAAT